LLRFSINEKKEGWRVRVKRGRDSGRDERKGGEEDEREGRARQARDTGKQKMFVRFLPWEVCSIA
jgi:hypothetical protein